MEYIVPSVQMDESDVGPRPTPQTSLAGIGVVGTFGKGPLNTITTVGDFSQFVQKFGDDGDTLTGYKSVKAAFDQGAQDIKIVRIAGEGAAAATATLMDNGEPAKASVIVSAGSPGVWGNGIKVGVVQEGSSFDLAVSSGTAKEVFRGLTLDKLSVSSKLVTLAKAAGATVLPKTTAADVALAGGNDGAAVTDADYIGEIDSDSGKRTGLKLLEPAEVGIVLCAQQYSPQIHAALLTFVENCDLDEGLKVAILNSAPGMSVDAAVTQTQALDSDRGIFAYPWVEPAEAAGTYVAPDGYYAGRLSTLEPHMSPSNKQILGILSCENAYTYAEVKTLTLARISPITAVRDRGFRIRNGLTLSSDSAWDQTNIRRQQDKMEMELYPALQWAISEPHDEKLWGDVAAQIDMYLQVEMNLRHIRGWKPTLCDKFTNPSEMVAARILTAIIRWLPLYAADFIVGRFKRLLSDEGN